jgi:uncharacterized membrane protein (DUF441 family)
VSLYNGTEIEVSLIITDAVLLCAVTTRVSAPSVSASFKSVTEIVATPLELITAFPLREPPDTSAALMPERV